MATTTRPLAAFLRVLGRTGPGAVRALAEQLGLPRRAAAEALAAAAGLALAGLARHQRRRPRNASAASGVVKKYGRPMDLEAPEIGIAAHLAKRTLSPRVGGLLGDAGPRAALWLSTRGPGATPEALGRAIAAATPLVLGAVARAVEPGPLADWLAEVPDAALDDPARLLGADGAPAEAFRTLRRLGVSRWARTLGLEG